MDVVSSLNEKLLNQRFGNMQPEDALLEHYLQVASVYSSFENALVVLSDLKAGESYVFYGGVAELLGMQKEVDMKKIHSIWEEEIFEKIHPEDLLYKHTLELQFFHQLKGMPVTEWRNYHIKSRIRMQNGNGEYMSMEHRTFYISGGTDGTLWLGLCLYNHLYMPGGQPAYEGMIVNSVTGEGVKLTKKDCHTILSKREKEILKLIEGGKASKEIAGLLNISIYTVNRHRQNILEKLRVKNSPEACRVAGRMGLLD